MRLSRCLFCGRLLYANTIPFVCNACLLYDQRRVLIYIAIAIPAATAILVLRMLAR